MEDITDIAQVFKSLGDEVRLRILALLCTEGELCICEIVEPLNLPQSTVSRHVSYLKNAGWIKDRRQGVWRFYSIREDIGPLKEALIPILCKEFASSRTAIEDINRFKSENLRNKCGTTARDTDNIHCDIEAS